MSTLTDLQPFVDMVHATAAALGIEQRFDDGISWLHNGRANEFSFLFEHPTAGPVTTRFDGELAVMFVGGDEAIREVVIAELDGIPRSIKHERKVLGEFTVSRRDKYKRGDVEASDGWRLFRDGKGRL